MKFFFLSVKSSSSGILCCLPPTSCVRFKTLPLLMYSPDSEVGNGVTETGGETLTCTFVIWCLFAACKHTRLPARAHMCEHALDGRCWCEKIKTFQVINSVLIDFHPHRGRVVGS